MKTVRQNRSMAQTQWYRTQLGKHVLRFSVTNGMQEIITNLFFFFFIIILLLLLISSSQFSLTCVEKEEEEEAAAAAKNGHNF